MYTLLKTIILIYLSMKVTAFYQDQFSFAIIKPKSNEELTKTLCSKYQHKQCVDDDFKIIILDRVYDFIGTEGTTTQKGCWHLSSETCYRKGQQQLNINNQCAGLESVDVTYDNAGRNPLLVGSNKYIIGVGQAGIKGKGVYLYSVHDVVIQNLRITEINPQLIWGGDAIYMDNATNILIDRNYVKNIGRQMVVTGFGSCQGVTISNNEFNGNTPYSAYCNDRHYWMFLFLGKNDTITMYNNTIHEASGRLPHLTGMMNSSVLLHMIENNFYNITNSAGIEALESTARILVEGNTYTDDASIIKNNHGSLYFPLTQAQCDACNSYIRRPCKANVITNSITKNVDTDVRVLNDLKPYASFLIKPKNF